MKDEIGNTIKTEDEEGAMAAAKDRLFIFLLTVIPQDAGMMEYWNHGMLG